MSAFLANKIRRMLGSALLTLIDDAKKIQQVQVTMLSEEVRGRVNRPQNYGFTSVPLEGAQAVGAALGGHPDHIVILVCDDGRHRKKGLQSGEVAMYTDEGDYILFKRGRIIEVVAGSKVTVTAPEVDVIATTKVKLDTPTVEMTGDCNVAGTITGAHVKQGEIELGTHGHSGVQSGLVKSGAPVTLP